MCCAITMIGLLLLSMNTEAHHGPMLIFKAGKRHGGGGGGGLSTLLAAGVVAKLLQQGGGGGNVEFFYTLKIKYMNELFSPENL